MDDIYFINGPIRKFVRQQCDCENSFSIESTRFKQHLDGAKKDFYTITIQYEPDECNICGIPYKIWFDTSNIVRVTNIGDE